MSWNLARLYWWLWFFLNCLSNTVPTAYVFWWLQLSGWSVSTRQPTGNSVNWACLSTAESNYLCTSVPAVVRNLIQVLIPLPISDSKQMWSEWCSSEQLLQRVHVTFRLLFHRVTTRTNQARVSWLDEGHTAGSYCNVSEQAHLKYVIKVTQLL